MGMLTPNLDEPTDNVQFMDLLFLSLQSNANATQTL